MRSRETGKKETVKITGFTLLAVLSIAAVPVQAGETGDSDALVRNAMIQRIEPVGKVRTAASDAQTEDIAVAVEEPAGAVATENTETAAEGATTAAESSVTAESADSATETANPEAAAESAGAETTADAGTASAGVDAATLVALIGSGTQPEGATDHIKSTVDGICIGCHLTGVAGAPKIGDKAAWSPRAETGLAAMTATVVSGKNAMPPRGASTLTDEEIPLAIQYLIGKQ